jgi:hypothetical protein
MNVSRIILLLLASVDLQGTLHAQVKQKEEKITGTFNLSLASDMRKMDRFFPV